jgi:hypothetical protein
MNPIRETISPCLTTQLTTLENFLLVKINDSGELEWNNKDLEALASSYDRGERNEETTKAKLLRLMWEQGYTTAMDDMELMNKRTYILMNCTAGNA